MLRAFLWVIIAVLVGAVAWLLFFGVAEEPPTEMQSSDATKPPAEQVTPAPESPAEPASPPPASDSEKLQFRNLVLSGGYSAPSTPAEAPESSADIVYLKSGKKLKGKIISDNVDALMFQTEGGTQVQRIPRSDILRTTTELQEAARSAAKGGTPKADALPDEEKAELYMSPEEYKKRQIEKRVDRLERFRKKGGVRAPEMARELKEEIEKKNRGIETIQKEEE
ncbi:MAG: hypothetical protein AB1696_17555 [Planctomycetota bacterium]